MSEWTPTGGALDAINEGFHETYEAGRQGAEDQGPVLVHVGDVIALYRSGGREARTVVPRASNLIRSVAHAPLAAFMATYLLRDGRLDGTARGRLEGLLQSLRRARGELEGEALEVNVVGDLRRVLDAVEPFVVRVLEEGVAPRDAVKGFARALGPLLLRLTDHATRFQLEALHRETDALVCMLDASEQTRLEVVIAGAHQARDRSLALQYFRKRFAEREGQEERVAYAENAADEKAAVALVGVRRWDRTLADAFFGDPKRLQRDVLGDAATARLEQFAP